MRSFIILAAGFLLTSCFGIASKPVAYAPNPGRIADPRAAARELILANVVQGCIAEPEATETMLIVKYACEGGGAGNAVIRFNDIKSITLDQSGDWYRVLVRHNSAADFDWTSRSLDDMQHLADALTALSPLAPPAPSKPDSTL
jgi:hypothetical protein